MATKHIIYTTGATLYGKSATDSPTTVAITENPTYAGLYPADTDNPFVYVQAGGTPAPTDTLLGDVREFYYGTTASGDLFHATRMHSWDWSQATVYDQTKALYTATRLMDKFNFIGVKTDEDQGLEFPRTRTLTDGTVCEIGGVSDIPQPIENAAYLISEALLSGRDPDMDFESQRVKVETFGPVRTEYATDKGPMQHTANTIPSPTAWALMRPFLEISTSFGVNRG